MTRPPYLKPTLDWLSVCNDAIACGRDWRADSDRYIRALPVQDKLTPTLFAVVLGQRERAGDRPDLVLELMDQMLNALAAAEGWTP